MFRKCSRWHSDSGYWCFHCCCYAVAPKKVQGMSLLTTVEIKPKVSHLLSCHRIAVEQWDILTFSCFAALPSCA